MKVGMIKELADSVDTEISEEKKRYVKSIIGAYKARIVAAEVMERVATERLTKAREDLLELLEDLKKF